MSPAGNHPRIELPPQEREYIRRGLARLGLPSLREYHRSVYWLCKHIAVKKRIPYRCRCGATRDLALHHKTYKNLGNERDEDLEFMCGPCHTRHHKRETQRLKREDWERRNAARLDAEKRVRRLTDRFNQRLTRRVVRWVRQQEAARRALRDEPISRVRNELRARYRLFNQLAGLADEWRDRRAKAKLRKLGAAFDRAGATAPVA